MIEWFNSLGITVAQVLAGAGAILLAFFSARFGARESRRQYLEKAETDKRQAAADLIHLLMAFAFDCERRRIEVSFHPESTSLSARGHGLRGLVLPAECNRLAAVLGGNVAARVLKIQVLKTRMDNAISAELDIGCPVDIEAPDRVTSWLALLELRSRYVADLAAKAAGLSVSHREEEFEALRKEAHRYADQIDSGEEGRWAAPLPSRIDD